MNNLFKKKPPEQSRGFFGFQNKRKLFITVTTWAVTTTAMAMARNGKNEHHQAYNARNTNNIV